MRALLAINFIFVLGLVNCKPPTLPCEIVASRINELIKESADPSISFGCFSGSYMGKGSTALAYHLISKKGSDVVAKVTSFKGENENNLARMKLEFDLLNTVKHKNVIRQFMGKVDESAKLTFQLLEYANQGSLQSFIKDPKNEKKLDDINFVLQVILDILKGLKAIHTQKFTDPKKRSPVYYCHTDLKTANIVMHDGSAKIIDFDMIEPLGATGVTHGTPYYLDPRLVDGVAVYDEFVDVYTVGIILYAMLHKDKAPYDGYSLLNLNFNIRKGQYKIRSGVHWLAATIIIICTRQDAMARPTINTLIRLIETYLDDAYEIPKVFLDEVKVDATKKTFRARGLTFASIFDSEKIPDLELSDHSFNFEVIQPKKLPSNPAHNRGHSVGVRYPEPKKGFELPSLDPKYLVLPKMAVPHYAKKLEPLVPLRRGPGKIRRNLQKVEIRRSDEARMDALRDVVEEPQKPVSVNEELRRFQNHLAQKRQLAADLGRPTSQGRAFGGSIRNRV